MRFSGPGELRPGSHWMSLKLVVTTGGQRESSCEQPEIDETTCFRISRRAAMTDGGVYTAYMCFWDERAALCSALPLQACEGCNNAGLNYREQLGGRVLGPPGTEISVQNGSDGAHQHHQGHSHCGITHTCDFARCLL